MDGGAQVSGKWLTVNMSRICVPVDKCCQLWA